MKNCVVHIQGHCLGALTDFWFGQSNCHAIHKRFPKTLLQGRGPSFSRAMWSPRLQARSVESDWWDRKSLPPGKCFLTFAVIQSIANMALP